MIRIGKVAYTRLKTADLVSASAFATKILGLQPADSRQGERHFRSDDRAQTLSYAEGDPADNVIAFAIDEDDLDPAAATLERLGLAVRRGTRDECEVRQVRDFIAFEDFGGTRIELAASQQVSGSRMFPSRDGGVTGFSHVGLYSSDVGRDEHFWTQVCNARVSDWVGQLPLLRTTQVHHSIALIPAPKSGIQHINHQVASIDDVLRSYNLLRQHNVRIVFGAGRHPTSGARFVYFEGPDKMVYEFSVGVNEVDEDTYRERQFGFEPSSFCMWGSRPDLAELRAGQ